MIEFNYKENSLVQKERPKFTVQILVQDKGIVANTGAILCYNSGQGPLLLRF